MMEMPSLVQIDVDKLFEQHTVQEIDQILKKLQNDVEEKKEELRMMVGERYRDLLKAADTIGHMKETSANVHGNVEEIMRCCSNLKDQQLIGFRMDRSVPDRNAEKCVQNLYAITVQIKLLTQLPEMIWTKIGQEDYFLATQLFIFSRHISTGLNLEINKPIMRSFPVAGKLWTVLSSFFHTIKQSCLTTLEREILSPSIAAKCLASIYLLENSTCERLLTTFIKLRTKALKRTLTEDNQQHLRVKDRILSSVGVIINTIELIHKCFVDFDGNRQGLLVNELNSLKSAEAKPTISLISTENPMMIALLPDIIANFKPRVDVVLFAADGLRSLMQSWLQFNAQDAGNQLKSLISAIASVKTIHYIKTEASAIEKPANWKTILEELFLPPNLDLYNFYYQPLINGRVEEIITTSWKEVINQTRNEINNLLKLEQKNNKVSPFIWMEDQTDIPLSLKQALSQNKENHKLLLKTKGYTVGIVSVCHSLDAKLKILFEDLKLFLCGEGDLKSHPNNQEDADGIVGFLRTSSKQGVLELISVIKSMDYKRNQSSLIFLATILQSLTELCPHLKCCLFKDISSTWEQRSLNDLEHWENLCRLLDDESLQFWKMWIDIFINDLLCDQICFNGSTNLVMALREFTNWENISIEEKDDQENPIESTIRIPSQPSISLQTFLYKICSNLNRAVPHVLPKTVTAVLADRIVLELHETYRTLSENEFVQSNQNTSLQYFFDVKFINVIFGRPENKKSVENLQSLAAAFKKNVDPFDFELFYKYLMANVKKSAFRMQHKLGSIIGNFEHLATAIGGTQQPVTSSEKDPNVLPLSTIDAASGWFPLLPVTIPANLKTQSGNSKTQEFDKPKSKKSNQPSSSSSSPSTLVQQPVSAQNLANVRSGAAAFFGGLSQDWFR